MLGECAVKINEVINEGIGNVAKGIAKGALGAVGTVGAGALRALVGNQEYDATAKWLKDKAKEKAKKLAAKATASNTETIPEPTAPSTPTASDNNAALQGKQLPVVVKLPSGKEAIKFQNKVFTLNDNGEWQYFGSNKSVTKDLQDEFDAVIGYKEPTAPARAPAQQTAPATMQSSTPAPAQQTAAPQQTTPPPQQTATTSAPQLTRMPDGSTVVTDKHNVKWTKPTGKDYWVGPQDAIVMPGHEEYNKLNSFSQNLKEGRKK